MTWLEFKTLVKDFLTVDADRLGATTYVDQMIRQAVIELQYFIEYYQQNHETIYTQDDLTTEGEASVGSQPAAARLREAFYVQVGYPCIRQPMEDYPWPSRYDLICGVLTTVDCQYAMAIDPKGGSFYVFPKVVDGRQISLFWDGIRLEFADGDTVPFDEAMALCVADFVTAKVSRRVDRDIAMHDSYMSTYAIKRRQLYADCRTRPMLTGTRDSGQSPTTWRSLCAAADDTDIEVVLTGDSGELATIADTEEVANFVAALEPDIVVHLGDTNYPSGLITTMQDYFTKFYAQWLTDYFYLAFGEHDIEGNSGDDLLAILPLVEAANSGKKYYDFVKGEVHFIVLNSGYSDADPREADGITAGSTQGAWAQDKLANSGSTWKVVICHRAPYTSDLTHTPGSAAMRWSFLPWGADLVISAHGHNYERVLVDGMTYLVCGLGGATKRGFGALTQGSQLRYSANNAVLRLVANATRLQVNLITVDGTIVDTLVLKQAV